MKETKLYLAQKEIDKLKERLLTAETTKTNALTELEQAKQTVDDLTKKLKILAVETNPKGELKQDFGNMNKQYADVFSDLNAAKQELIRIHHDRETAIEEHNAAIKQGTESELMKKVNVDRAGGISKEILSFKETVEQVKLATMEAQQEQEKIFAEKNVQKLAHKAALEESLKKLLALRVRVDPENSKDFENKYTETTSEIKRLQMEMENVRASDLDSLKTVTFELDGAKNSLQKVVEEESLLKRLLESLKIELENTKNEHEQLKKKEAETESVAGNLNSNLQKSKNNLENECIEEAKGMGFCNEMMLTFQELKLENENARRESEEMKMKAEELKKESESMRIGLKEAESKLKIALMEADEAKKAESKARDDIKTVLDRTNASRTSTSNPGSKITISREEYEALTMKVVESEKLAEMKEEAAKSQVEAVKASETEALKKLEATQKEIGRLKAATEVALKRAEAAETCRKSVEGEVKRWREREQRKAAEAVAMMLQETQTVTSLPSTPTHKQTPPQKQKTKKILISNLSGIFHRKKSQVDAGSSPSYLPGETPV